jgi:hypothetical protein
MWMRNCDTADAATRFDFRTRFLVEVSNAIPQQISSGRLQKQSPLAYGKFWFSADSEKLPRFIFNAVAMISL